jgi:hypothetical protein
MKCGMVRASSSIKMADYMMVTGNKTIWTDLGKLAYDGEWKDDQFCGHGILYNE